MKTLSWNIQWAKGMDGRVQPERIAQEIERINPDIVALQEVCRNYPTNTGESPADQPEWFARRFSRAGYQVVFGAAVDTVDDAGEPMQFGNLILTRYPVQRILKHVLPHPADPDNPGSARSALELMLSTPNGPLRFTTTHLSYHSVRQRTAQIDYLRHRHAEASLWFHFPPCKPDTSHTPLRTTPESLRAILCGDFNTDPGDVALQILAKAFDLGEFKDLVEANKNPTKVVPAFLDAWEVAHPGQPHAPTLSVHDPQRSPICFDYFYVSEDLVPAIESFEVFKDTMASDHQPCLVTFRGGGQPRCLPAGSAPRLAFELHENGTDAVRAPTDQGRVADEPGFGQIVLGEASGLSNAEHRPSSKTGSSHV
ncbi:endonuclease/exonuclease/phosphatase family protein [Candidatus Symbiobacter mobilis]|uniref:Exonuclease-endonuclease-phosphatase domain superfamily protein n=1 Tax=Candidatus Symbiobacter mobilis CR TaxID=946483 RepID=U5NF02_9BURK|nr:endonuclease/exonuclease/phosphatase family protein [Candidatus Symbiobacter mobilis]AGX88744.1 exonuclease-endonuclease-phosphatase domain superfamily protein [Candidatus Symbiobacter mobilis CR]